MSTLVGSAGAEVSVDPRRIARTHALSRLLLWLVMIVGWLVLAGWQFDVEMFKSILPGRVAMNPLTAFAFVLAAGALWVLERESRGSLRAARRVHAVAIAACPASTIGAVTVFGYAVGDNVGLDQLLFRARLGSNRIAPNTALSFIFVGAALLLLDWEPRRGVRPAQILALVPIAIALTSILGYAYAVGELYAVAGYIPMALPTAAAFLALGVAILCAHPDRGLMAVIGSDLLGGALARQLLPAAAAIPALLSGLWLLGHRAGLFGAELGLALVAVGNILAFAAL